LTGQGVHGGAQRCIFALALSVTLVGCAILPSTAPTVGELTFPQTTSNTFNYFLVDMDAHVAEALATYHRPGFASAFGSGSYRPVIILRPGDSVGITIFELNSGPVSLFGPSAPTQPNPPGAVPQVAALPTGHATTLPPQLVELDGAVEIPFAGHVKVGGMSPAAAGQAIEKALAGKALEPQVVVTLISTELNVVTVGGDVGSPKAVPLTARGERVLDVIAAAGGAKYESYDCDVRLIRGGRVAAVNLRRIVDDPAENVRVRPGDSLFVSYNPRTYTVLGSAMKASHYNFNHETISLAEAVAQAGGGNDNVTNISGIYLLRYEPRGVIQRILPPEPARQPEVARWLDVDYYPVAYHVNLREARGYFLSQTVQIRNKDLILMTDADLVAVNKVLNTAHTISEIYFDIVAPTARGGSLFATDP
jgi:polysaccharide biosynthesis/export protein